MTDFSASLNSSKNVKIPSPPIVPEMESESAQQPNSKSASKLAPNLETEADVTDMPNTNSNHSTLKKPANSLANTSLLDEIQNETGFFGPTGTLTKSNLRQYNISGGSIKSLKSDLDSRHYEKIDFNQ